MNLGSTPPLSALDAIAHGRQTVLTRAHQLLGTEPIPLSERFDALPAVTGLLMTSLEELKVAEEELREQNSRLMAVHAERERVAAYYRRLFEMLPVAAIITDRLSSILETNLAAETMFAREAHRMERKPLAAMVHPDYRDTFRRKLQLLAEVDGATRMRLVFNRVGDVPIEVEATVQRVPDAGPTGAGVLLWMLDRSVG